MPDIVIFVGNIGPDDEGDGVLYGGIARCSGMTLADNNINWWTNQDAGATAAAVNAAIKAAAIAAADVAGYTVGILDKKTLIGAAVGL